MTADYWRNKRVLVTGHTGFKGSWLVMLLSRLGARIAGIALSPETSPNLFDAARVSILLDSDVRVDLRDAVSVTEAVAAFKPEIVIHLAAQALVRRSYADPLETFETNVVGTAKLLEACRGTESIRTIVVITTDKVYANHEWAWPYRETDTLGGRDPYSASKAASELVVASYRDSFFTPAGVRIATARAGNVIGGGDWSDDRLIPDAVRAWSAGQPLAVRRPESVRPWQHVLEPLVGYLRLAEALDQGVVESGAFNFGPHAGDAVHVRRAIDLAAAEWGMDAMVDYALGTEGPHEAKLLALDISRARSTIAFEPRWRLDVAVARTVHWYREHLAGCDPLELCHRDIASYLSEQG